MYVTRPLSMYRKSPSTLSTPAPDAPYSGYMVITDEEAEIQDTFCWGTCKRKKVSRLPFPQDKILTIVYTSDYQETYKTKVWFVPVPNQPLSSNLYYVIKAKGKHKGYVCFLNFIHTCQNFITSFISCLMRLMVFWFKIGVFLRLSKNVTKF